MSLEIPTIKELCREEKYSREKEQEVIEQLVHHRKSIIEGIVQTYFPGQLLAKDLSKVDLEYKMIQKTHGQDPAIFYKKNINILHGAIEFYQSAYNQLLSQGKNPSPDSRWNNFVSSVISLPFLLYGMSGILALSSKKAKEIESDPSAAVITLESSDSYISKIKNLEYHLAKFEEYKSDLVLHNMRLAYYVAKNRAFDQSSFLDYFSEAQLALEKTGHSIVPNSANFGKFAAFKMNRNISKLHIREKQIRLPKNMHEKRSKLIKLRDQLYFDLGYIPSDNVLAVESGLPKNTVTVLLNVGSELSLDSVFRDSENSLHDILPDVGVEDPSRAAEKLDAAERVLKLVNTLTEKERFVITHTYGLSGAQRMTLQEVGHIFGLTGERIRQIQSKAEKKLKMRIEKEF